MKRLAAAAFCVFALAACDDGTAQDNMPRTVEQDRLHSPIAPLEAVDDAVNVEAVNAMRLIHTAVKQKAVMSSDPAVLYRQISGTLGSSQLSALGLSASDLKGTLYQASDYKIAISGKNMTITAGRPGTRGYVAPQSFTLP